MSQTPNENLPEQSEVFLAQRRKLLRMGAAGLPMVLTLRASAAGAAVSQLQCLFTIPNKTKILVDDSGQAWVGTGRVRTDRNKGFKISSVDKFKADADYVFPAGSVPISYRPNGCGGNNTGNNGWIDCGYALTKYGRRHSITPGDYVTGAGAWNLSGDDGLYIELSMAYADRHGSMGGWPGISCIVSILTYLGN